MASKIHEIASCRTVDGSLCNTLWGGNKIRATKAMERGLKIEEDVIHVVEGKLAMKFERSGIHLMQNNPLIGASPDGINSDYVLEIKSPANAKTFKKYLSDGVPAAKYYAQVQLQMHVTGRKKGLFCIADPDFEKNREIHTVEVMYNESYILKKIEQATNFWVEAVWPELREL